MKTKTLFLAITALLVFGAVAAYSAHNTKRDDGVPAAALDGKYNGPKIAHRDLFNSIIDCQKLVPKLRPRVCGPLPTIAGPAGAAGAVGAQGPAGPEGPAGPAGKDGATGPVGPGCTEPAPPVLETAAVQDEPVNACQGPKGDKGDEGPKGDEGLQGETGPQGEKGDIGPRGYKGDTGPKGDTGDAGEKGAKGDTGPAGSLEGAGTLDVCVVGNSIHPGTCSDNDKGNNGVDYTLLTKNAS